MSIKIDTEIEDKYKKLKANHTCKGERYLSGCTACWVNTHELNGIPKSDLIIILKSNGQL